MVQAGGPAAINGFLYQILHHLAWFADIRISGKVAGNCFEGNASLVFEPRDGGDARCDDAKTTVVEQYKTRPDRTWSVNDIINDVLPDLRKAVSQADIRKGVYIFVTDGRAGRLEEFKKFLNVLKACGNTAEIDDVSQKKFGKGLPTTYRKLCEHIAEKTRSGKDKSKSADEDSVVLKLLQNFEMRFEVSADDRSQDVEQFLRPFTPNLGDESGVRIHLIGQLMERLAQGELRLDSAGLDALLRKVGLNPDRLRKLAVLNATMIPLVKDSLSSRNYKPEKDVRLPPHWPEEKSVFVLSGRSGDGKTWQLGRVISHLGESQKVAVFIGVGSTTDETLNRAIRLIWQDGLGETSEKSPNALANHYKDIRPDTFRHWLTIGVDDVRSIDLARDLIRQPWQRWGMRLILTVPRAVASSLKSEPPEYAHFGEVGRFSVDELDALLHKHRQRWADLPKDLQKLLRTPILAGLYVALDKAAFHSAPDSEYEIFDKFWWRMESGTQSGDPGILYALAGRVVDEKAYPLPRSCWCEVGLTDESFTRLDSMGWLQSTETSVVAFAHDRLLNWSVAKEVVRRYQAKEWALDTLTEFLTKCAQPPLFGNVKRLDYVPMDALWLLLSERSEWADCVTLLESFEQDHTYGSYASELYQHLLPTLGSRVVSLLLARLAKLESMNESDYRARLIADAMVALARQESVDLTRETASLVESSAELNQKVGIALLSITPVAGLLDRLWELHVERCEGLDSSRLNDSKFGRSHGAYEASHAALRVGVSQKPEWLRNQLLKLNPDTARVSELGYLLNSLDHPLASTIWNETKGLLFANMPKDRQRSLVYCIGKFKDQSEVGFLVNSLGQQVDSIGGAALASLVKLDPDLALRHLSDDVDGSFVNYRGWWLPDLMLARPAETRNRLLEIAENSTEGHRFIERLFEGRANELDRPLLDLLLRSFKHSLSANVETTCKGDATWITSPLRLFNEIATPDLLALMIEKSKGELETTLVKVACSRIGRSGSIHDHALEEARTFLILLSGGGITELVNAELQSPQYWGRYGGLKWAMIRPDTTTLTLLGEIARAPVIFDANGKPTSEWVQENFNAMRVLAGSQADELLVDAIWTRGSPYFSADLAEMRGVMAPMFKAVTQRAAETLVNFETASDDERCSALITAWVSADLDFVAPIHSVLPSIAATALEAVYACVALREFGDKSQALAQFANRLLGCKEQRFAGIDTLLWLGDSGVPHLIKYLEAMPFQDWQDEGVRLLRALASHEKSHRFAVEKARQYCLNVGSAFDFPFELAAESSDTQVGELILEKAFEAASFFPQNRYSAIRGLAKFNYERAIEAIRHHLKTVGTYERELCVLLSEVAPENAPQLLFDLAVEVQRKSLCASAGRVLRRLAPKDVDDVLSVAFASPNRRDRAVAAELAGWLPLDRLAVELAALYAGEREDEVRKAMFSAHTRRNIHVIAREVLDSFKGCQEEERWALLLSILQLGDPILLSDSKDELWIGAALDSVPHKFWHFAEQEIEAKINKLEKGN